MLVCWWWWFDWSFARLVAPVVQLSPPLRNCQLCICCIKYLPSRGRWKWQSASCCDSSQHTLRRLHPTKLGKPMSTHARSATKTFDLQNQSKSEARLASCHSGSVTVQSRIQETAKDLFDWMMIVVLVRLNWHLRNVLTYLLIYRS